MTGRHRGAASGPGRLILAVVATALLVLAACTPGGKAKNEPSHTPAPGVETGVPAKGTFTLVVWDQEVRGGQDEEITQLNDEFMEKYPNVTIKRVSKSFTDLLNTVKLAVSGPNPPDVVEANQGWGVMGAMVKAELLRPLDDYAKAYGWDQRFAKPLLDLNSFTSDGTKFGTGSLYGLSQTGEYVGVYYNKDKLDALGVGVPTTFDEFQADLQKAKDAGETPIEFGNLDKWPGIHEFGAVQNQVVSKDQIRDFVFGRSGSSFTTSDNVDAATMLSEWADGGFFTEGFNGLSYDDSWAKFGEGDGVFLISGTWLAPDLEKAMGEGVGMFPIPPKDPAAGPVATGGEGLPLAITAKSKNAQVAAAYIDFLTSDHAMDVITQNNLLPAVPPANPPTTGILGDVFDGWDALNAADGLVPYLDYTTPTFYDTITADVQELMGGKVDPKGFVDRAQQDYDSFYSA